MKTPLLLAAFAASGLAASAQVLMFDFGPTAVAGTSQTNSPYHTVNGTFLGSTWNGLVDDSSNLFYADGSAATGVSINVGAAAASSSLNTIALGTTPSNSALAGASGTNTGVYGSTSVGRDAIFRTISLTGPSRNAGSVGVQIGGLSAGTYDIYLTGRNTNLTASSFANSTTEKITAFAGAGSTGDFTFDGYAATGSNTFAGTASYVSTWVQGENFIKLTVTLGANQSLNIGVWGQGSTAGGTTIDERGFLNSLQIVPVSSVPEPSAFAMVAGAGVIAFAAFRRRRVG